MYFVVLLPDISNVNGGCPNLDLDRHRCRSRSVARFVQLIQTARQVDRQVEQICMYVCVGLTGFPLRLENLEKWEGIFKSGKSQGILNRLEKSGKTTPNTGKLREFQKKIICYFSMIFK